MGPQEWIAFGGLMVALLGFGLGIMGRQSKNRDAILHKIDANKDDLDSELMAMRISAYEEYKILRKEMAESSSMSYREFGESLMAIREKVNQIELWTRDQLKETRHTLTGSMDVRHQKLEEMMGTINERIRQLEIGAARISSRAPRPA